MPLNGDLPAEVDVLIVGSGFGGSVMAAELARARRRDGESVNICLVERGQAYPPGSFPRDPAGVSRNFWAPNSGLYGMFNVWSFAKLDAVVSSGLGGGSLIYANVMLRKDATWFTQRHPTNPDADEHWMLTADDLKPHYRKVLDFLQVQELPHGATDPAEFRLAKTTRFLQNVLKANIPKPIEDGVRTLDANAARLYAMDLNDALTEFEGVGGYAPLAVRFRGAEGQAAIGAPLPPESYGSVHENIHRTTCTLVGECDVGCNQGAKNTLDHTYLSEASYNGVSIHTLTEVVALKRHTDGKDYPFEVTVQRRQAPETAYPDTTVGRWAPTYAFPSTSTDGAVIETTTINARRVVLAAGTLGTTSLLLRHGENLGFKDEETPVLGSRFCGNGDFLGFVHGVEGKLDCTRGPVITAYRRYAADTDPPESADTPDPGGDGHSDGRHGMYIEDAGYPVFVAWLVQLAQSGTMGKNLLSMWLRRWFTNRSAPGPLPPISDISAELHTILAGGDFASKVMPLLGMGREPPVGRLTLANDDPRSLKCEWEIDRTEGYYATMESRMRIIARGFKGKFLSNPLYSCFERGITVHPVGGCPMDTTMDAGVVDTYGRVRGVPGLRVCDGSVFPGPIGPNPSLTIAAFASRAAENLLTEDWTAPAPDADEYQPTDWLDAHPHLPRRPAPSQHVDPEK